MSNVFEAIPLGWAFKINGSVQAYKGVGAAVQYKLPDGRHVDVIVVTKDVADLNAIRKHEDDQSEKFWPLAVCHGDHVEWNPKAAPAPAPDPNEDW